VRRGRIASGPGDVRWAESHAALPVAVAAPDGRLRVFFSARDRQQCSRIGCVPVDPEDWTVGPVSPEPTLDIGPLGAFDDHGVTSSWVVIHEGRWYHYYTGWTTGGTVPFHFFVGLAVAARGDDPPSRVSPAPILGRDGVDPFLTASPCVLVEDGLWRMWYVSGLRWERASGGPRHYYHIRYAESDDGVEWRRDGRVCIDFAGPHEYAIARPCVVRTPSGYRMWYCSRGESYRLGYAESPDGLIWTRRDSEAGLQPSEVGWDSEMIAYPYVFTVGSRCFMLYNGNGYGRTGFGFAEWTDDSPA
jgi:hypothetical protein